MIERSVSPERLDGPQDRTGVRVAVKVAILESLASWAVRRTLEAGYHRATGQVPPTARDRDVPFRRILVWAGVTAAAIAVANVVVDRVALRHQPRHDDR